MPKAKTQTQAFQTSALAQLWRKPWVSWVGFRYLKSKQNSSFLSFITLLSILGVGLGVTAMIVVLSVMDGFESELKKRMMSSQLHVLIQPTVKLPEFQRGFVPEQIMPIRALQKLADPRFQAEVSPVVSTEAILKVGRKVSGVVLKGVGPERLKTLKSQVVEEADSSDLEPQSQKLEGNSQPQIKQEEQLQGLWVGQELAYELSLLPGDAVSLISPTEFEGPIEGVPRIKRYRVEGVYHSGLPEQELHTVYSSAALVHSFLKKNHVLSQWEISLPDFSQAPLLAHELRALLPGFKVQDWVQMNSHLFASLRLERLAMFVCLAFIIVVASFNIVTTLTLMVLEKKREISILKAMGAKNAEVAGIFLGEGLFIGGIGVGGGVVLGWLLCILLKRYEFISLPEIYYDRTLPVTFELKYYLAVTAVAFFIVLGACLYPSRRAAELNPIDGIRFG